MHLPWDRKGTLLFNNIFSIVPAVMMGVSEIAKTYEIIIVARFIVGICAGQICSTLKVIKCKRVILVTLYMMGCA